QINGIWLAKWLDEQRQIRNGKRKGKSLTAEQIRRLDNIGMRWEKKEEIQWQQQYADAKAYYEAHGNLNIPQSYLSKNGKRTGLWLQRQRKKLKDGLLNQKQVQLLRAVGI
ncbi:MAG: helicase associated domain-containing protein, partial [Eubacteriales bacterium]|nr:helicase associated domain-containing protein [Eubacteriales bacterium]